MFDDVFNLRCKIKRQGRKLGVHCSDKTQRMGRPIQEIRVAESDVRGSRLNLSTDVFQYNLLRDDKETSIVNRRNWAVRAEVFAPAAAFGVSDQSVFAAMR